MRNLLQKAQWLNALVLFGQILNNAVGVFPGLAINPWFLSVQAVLGVLLPSLGGVSHAIAGTTVVEKG